MLHACISVSFDAEEEDTYAVGRRESCRQSLLKKEDGVSEVLRV